jgi:ribosomal protein S18 acetylase RimI-like enzyme
MPNVTLNIMSDAAYQSWLEWCIADYAAEKVKVGTWLQADSLELSKKEFERLLPSGIATPENYLYSIHDTESGEDVGVLWLADRTWNGQRLGFIYEVLVHEQFRRRGYARAGMLVLEEKAKALGIEKMALHVFGSNQGALALYQEIGYEITDYSMAKSIS